MSKCLFNRLSCPVMFEDKSLQSFCLIMKRDSSNWFGQLMLHYWLMFGLQLHFEAFLQHQVRWKQFSIGISQTKIICCDSRSHAKSFMCVFGFSEHILTINLKMGKILFSP